MKADLEKNLATTIAQITERRPSQPDLWFDPGYLFRIQSEQRLFLDALRNQGFKTLKGLRILDIGCGFGFWLRCFAEWGAAPCDLHGIDILEDRVAEARRQCPPGTSLQCANATRLEFDDAAFDVVVLSLVLSLMPDDTMRSQLAAEASRVLKPGGIVLWYDFRYSPPRGHGEMIAMTRRRIAAAFPGFDSCLHSASAAPPITRRLASRAWSFCTWLDNISFLNTHYAGVLIKRASGADP